MSSVIFRRGLDLKSAVSDALGRDYRSQVVDQMKTSGHVRTTGRLTIRLASEFGFCYGVDRAVDYAYQARTKFPDQRVFLTGEIIHNPHVNDKLRASGVLFLDDPGYAVEQLTPEDVVILPAFGVTVSLLQMLDARGCTLVDTTCGSVLNVWKNVVRYSQDGFTSVIHGKVHHEETQATASQALKTPGGRYLIVLNRPEAQFVCDYILHGGDDSAFLTRMGHAASPGFDPSRDLVRVGLANQTTMLMSESLDVGEVFRATMETRYGREHISEHFRAFDTICSATQDRQDAVVRLLEDHRPDLMVVIGGYNSSNTVNLARLCAEQVPTYHLADDSGLVSPALIRHRPVHATTDVETAGWLPTAGPVHIGLTAGASTPDNIVGAAILRLDGFAGA